MGFAKVSVVGMPATHAIRWMTAEGWNKVCIRRVLNYLGATSIKDNTINCQITAVKTGKMGPPYTSEWQREQLLAAKEKSKVLVEEHTPMSTSQEDKTARFENPACSRCGMPIEEGMPIEKYTSQSGKTSWVHKGCKPAIPTVANQTNSERLTNAIEKASEQLNGHAVCKFTDSHENKLRGIESYQVVLDDRTKQLEELVEKQAQQIADLQKKQPPREIVLVTPDKKRTKLKKHVHPIFEQVLFHIEAGDNVQLVGPRGCGKSFLSEHVAEALGRRHGFLSLSGGVTEAKLFGRVTPDISSGKNIFHRALFAEMFEEGGVFLLDEVDAADPNVLLAVNSGLSSGQLALDRPRNPIAKRHEEFVCLAAANTWGNGADRQYVGRNQQDSAFTERFVQIGMDYDRELERALCPGADELLERLWKYRDNIKANRLERTVSTRFICRAYNWLQRKKDLDYVDQMCFSGWRIDEIKKAKGEL